MMHQRMEQEEKRSNWVKRQNQVARDYAIWCKGEAVNPWPVQYDYIAGFLCRHVEIHQGSTKSLANMTSSLRNHELNRRRQWLHKSEDYRLMRFIRQLEFLDTVPVKRAKPATLEVIDKIRKILITARPSDQLLYLCMLLLHNGMLRAGELFTVKFSDIEWCESECYFILWLGRSKTHRKGGPKEIYYSDYKGISAYTMLRWWCKTYSHKYSTYDYLIPKTTEKGKIQWNSKESASQWRIRLRIAFDKAGLPGRLYSGHSFRAGGATDLFSASMPTHDIQALGRWKSMAVMIYNRQAPRDVSRKASLAFQRKHNAIKRITRK